jgi:membrane dipeptidase
MEGCDLIAGPGELATWFERGVRLASLTWNGVNRYSSGTFGDETGLTQAGRELLMQFTTLGMILDLSHLSDRGVMDAFDCYNGPICATHSNSRSVAMSPRNLLDSQAQEIARRGGVVGLNLLASFVRGGWKDGDPLPSIPEAIDHVEYLAGLIGPAHLGLGSDLDGGLTSSNTPEGIDRIDHLYLLLDELGQRGWDRRQIDRFAGLNWWNFLERNLPD